MLRFIGSPRAQTGLIVLALASLMAAPSGLRADPPDEERAAIAVFTECVHKIHQEAYRQESEAAIISKALHGLVKELGEAYAAFDRDLSELPDAEAEAAFEAALAGIAKTPGQRRTLRELAESALQAYCRQHDKFTRYVRSEDWKLAQLTLGNAGSGIGMSLMESSGSFSCYPLPGSPADAAGLKSADKLLSVDGKQVEGKPLEYVVGLMKGAPGTEVMLRVEKGFGRAQNVKVVREAMNLPVVIADKKLSGMVLRIRRFAGNVIADTKKALADLSSSAVLTLDLRGCPGGEVETVVEFASMFLELNEPVATLRSRGQPDEVFVSRTPRLFKPRTISIIQDTGTASAAEILIAALMHSPNNRVSTQGEKTFGKGVYQTPFDLQGGGHLVLTTGEVIGPQGRSWDGIGLLPSLENEGRIFPKE